ncbi:uncharacterized protein MELLADRAFT_112777 [Melampsora larici-populina 98AG31]|uniref:Uncharacterized protein n=1 Tax=Melampsora larici-populina (strain 98AG31 / pathotype 3-4-7) TaxID=747676 RepID=F4S7K1_MELLP|nr:uncharacterized protein MELLADRAFT_112777 [Melampsora larici-populina 98AG31]EGF99332.1 hypothetical protein MELLADRAFT_112777 [Melampsora larici-populina 98AG31]
MQNQNLLTPTSLPRSGVKDEDLLVYWEDSPHHRSRTSNLTPLKSQPKRDSMAAGIPSPSEIVVNIHSSPSNGLPQPPLGVSTPSKSRRSLRQHKRLRDANIWARGTPYPSQTPTRTTPVLPRVLASTTNSNGLQIHKRTPDNRSMKPLLGTTISKPGLKPNAHTLQTSNCAPLKVTTLALHTHYTHGTPHSPYYQRPCPKPPNTNSINLANWTRMASVAKVPPLTKNPTAISRVPAKVPPPVPKVTTAAGPKILPRAQPAINPVKTNFNTTNFTTMKRFTTKTPVIAPTTTKTTKITPITTKTTTTTPITSASTKTTTKPVQHHGDESISLLRGLCAGDLDWDLDH